MVWVLRGRARGTHHDFTLADVSSGRTLTHRFRRSVTFVLAAQRHVFHGFPTFVSAAQQYITLSGRTLTNILCRPVALATLLLRQAPYARDFPPGWRRSADVSSGRTLIHIFRRSVTFVLAAQRRDFHGFPTFVPAAQQYILLMSGHTLTNIFCRPGALATLLLRQACNAAP